MIPRWVAPSCAKDPRSSKSRHPSPRTERELAQAFMSVSPIVSVISMLCAHPLRLFECVHAEEGSLRRPTDCGCPATITASCPCPGRRVNARSRALPHGRSTRLAQRAIGQIARAPSDARRGTGCRSLVRDQSTWATTCVRRLRRCHTNHAYSSMRPVPSCEQDGPLKRYSSSSSHARSVSL